MFKNPHRLRNAHLGSRICMSFELAPQSTDVPGSSLGSSLANGALCILLAQQVFSFVQLDLHLVQLGGLLLQLTLQLR